MLPLTSDNIYSEIQRDLLRPILISSVMASDTFVRDWTLSGEEDSERIVAYLTEIQQQYDTITAFYVSDQSRRYYHPDGVLKSVAEDDPQDAWYFRVRDMREPFEVNVDTDTADRSRVSIFINYRVLDYSGRYIGATGVGLSVDAVTRLIDTYQARYNRTIYFVVDRQGNITLTGQNYTGANRLQNRPAFAEVATQILSTPSTALTVTDDQDTTVYVNSRLVPEFDWYLIVEQTGAESATRLDSTLTLNLVLSGIIMTLVLLAAHVTLRSYQRKLEDIDHFKQVNDTHGHLAGDVVLQQVATVLREQIRDSDTLCRWGGEEFVMLLDNCPTDEAITRAEKIRQAIRSHTVPVGRAQIVVTLSMGITNYHIGEPLDRFMARADAALYQAKEEGRDRVILVQ